MKYKVEVAYQKSLLSDDITTHVEYFDEDEFDYPATRNLGNLVVVGNLTLQSSLFISSTVTEIEDEEDKEQFPTGFSVQINMSSDELVDTIKSGLSGCRAGC